jgi:hypothetical protein
MIEENGKMITKKEVTVYEYPDKNDYTKNNASHTNKIRKTLTPYISEAHDNFRKPHREHNPSADYLVKDANGEFTITKK